MLTSSLGQLSSESIGSILDFDLSQFIGLVLAVAALAILPIVALVCSCFLRVSIVLGILRAGLGAQGVVPAFVTSGFALIVTAHVMFPVLSACLKQAQHEASAVTESGKSALVERKEEEIAFNQWLGEWSTVISKGASPLLLFLTTNAGEREFEFARERYSNLSQGLVANGREGSRKLSWQIAIPAFVLSELRRGFESGILLILPLLLVDLIILFVFTALGVSGVSPQSIALPTKLLLFTLADGWIRLFDSLDRSYQW